MLIAIKALPLPRKRLCLEFFNAFFSAQIPATGTTSKITLTVQSQYNLEVESTSLLFDVCNNNAGGCANIGRTTITSDMTGTGITKRPEVQNQAVVIIIASLAGLIALALIIVGILCWKRKHNQTVAKKQGILLLRNVLYIIAIKCTVQMKVYIF